MTPAEITPSIVSIYGIIIYYLTYRSKIIDDYIMHKKINLDDGDVIIFIE